MEREEPVSSSGLQQSQNGHGIDATHLYYFFIPLPEPLGFSDGYIIECTVPAPMEWILRHGRARQDPPPKRLLDASLCFHRGAIEAGFGHEMAALFDVAARATGNKRRRWRPGGRRSRRRLPAADRTIVEMVIPVSVPQINPEGQQTAAAETDLMSEAFDRGLGYVRDIQRSYYLARRRPLHLATRSTLPFAVPMTTRSLEDASTRLRFEGLSMFMLNQNLDRDVRDEDLNDEALERLSLSMQEQGLNGIAARYLEFVREGEVALHLDGDTRAAALFSATASEVLLDESLAHMLWESALRPEDAAVLFDANPWLTSRVKGLYHPRIGGSWDVRAKTPVGAWFANVASLRNRVVHGGYEPSHDEAVLAGDSVGKLQDFLAERICARADTYPRTAMAMVGRPGLEARGAWTSSLEALVHSQDEVPWRETFVRWRAAMQRCRRDSPTYVEPHAENAVPVAVLHTDGHVEWVAHDPHAAMAARIRREDIDATERQLSMVGDHIIGLRGEGLEVDVSTVLSGATVKPSSAPHWVAEYRLLPLAGVMVDGKDLDYVRRSGGTME